MWVCSLGLFALLFYFCFHFIRFLHLEICTFTLFLFLSNPFAFAHSKKQHALRHICVGCAISNALFSNTIFRLSLLRTCAIHSLFCPSAAFIHEVQCIHTVLWIVHLYDMAWTAYVGDMSDDRIRTRRETKRVHCSFTLCIIVLSLSSIPNVFCVYVLLLLV